MRVAQPPELVDLVALASRPDRLGQIFQVGPLVDGRYLHWDELRHRTPPNNLTHEEWWTGLCLTRVMRPLPMRTKAGEHFSFASVDPIHERLHRIDRDASGQIALDEPVASPETRNKYIVSSLIEEAITSSQLEGASTTRRVAKEMLRSGRSPRTHGERMIANNFAAMEYIREHRTSPMSADFVFRLHEIVTRDTLELENATGRLRRPDEPVRVVDDRDGEVLHIPPEAKELVGRMKQMCRFANGDTPKQYLHPVLRAILLHFWLAYDHPFVDGNGRTARALFYWAMVKEDYWLAEFISISSVIKKAPAQYSRAFLFSETNQNDVSYFILHQLDVVLRAIDELQKYVRRKVQEARTAQKLLKKADGFNHRQIALLGHALRNPGASYTLAVHQRTHGVVYETARKDLTDLVERGLLSKSKSGKTHVFFPAEGLSTRLEG